jgi:hypothetical protein
MRLIGLRLIMSPFSFKLDRARFASKVGRHLPAVSAADFVDQRFA